MAGIQLGGLMSGFDTASMVESLMEAERLKVDKVEQQKIKLEWQQEAYTSITNKYSDFILEMRELFDISDSVSTHGQTRPGTLDKLTWLYKASSSNTSILDATVTSDAKPGKYEVEVKQLADSFKAASSGNISANKDGENLSEQLGLDPNLEINFKISNGTDEVVITGKASELTMDDFVDQINELDGVSASYDASIDRFFLQTDETGTESKLQISDMTAGGVMLDKLQLGLENNQTYSGQDAIIDFNGAENITFSSNDFKLQGIDFSLNSAKVGEVVTVNVTTDTEAVVEKVGTFVESYNELMTGIAKELGEVYDREYQPLTEAQKEDMTEKEIELWEEKAKTGLLRNDSIINSIQQSIKSSLVQDVTLSDGSKMSLFDIGIETKGYVSAATSFELQIDEEKLREALSEDPGKVTELFFGIPQDTDLHTSDRNLSPSQIEEKRQQSGIFNRITDIMVNGMGQLIQKAGVGDDIDKFRSVNSYVTLDFTTNGSRSLLDHSIIDTNERISDLNRRLAQVEARYWSDFTAMEVAISNLQSQQSALMSF